MISKPELQMLWESVEPTTALAERFGFAGVDAAAVWLSETLRDAWALDVESCDCLVMSASKLLAWVTIDGESFVAKCAVDPPLFPGLAEIDTLIAWLDAEGVPVAAPVRSRDGGLRVERDRISVGLYPAIKGDPLDVEDGHQRVAAGRTLALLHEALAAYPPRLTAVPGETGQLVHGDFRSANVLQRHGEIAAILDFDEACYQDRAWEVGRSAVLLGTKYHDWRPMSLANRATFIAAYSEVAPLTDSQRDSIDGVANAVLRHFGWS